MTLVRVVDLETSGMKPPEAGIVEVGWCDVSDGHIWLAGTGSSLVNPGHLIPPEAMAVHHIRNEDVVTAPPADVVLAQLFSGADIFAAHSAAFEQQFFSGGGKPWICTLKAARRVWPEAPGHSNQVLRYWLGLCVSDSAAMPPHRAQPDAYVTAWILHSLLKTGATLDQMVQWTKEPSLLPRVTFGKHLGKPWAELPRDYLQWLADKSEMDDDTKFTARHYLQKGTK